MAPSFRALAVAFFIAGCSCGGGSLGLRALAAQDVSWLVEYDATAPGDRLVRVEVELTNDAGRGLPLRATSFRLDPASGVSVAANEATSRLEGACVRGEDAILPAGDTVTCAVAFVVAPDFEPETITLTVDDLEASDAVPDLNGGTFDAGPRVDGAVYRDGAPSGPDAGRFDAGPPPPPTDELDLLLMIDTSNSMQEEQAALAMDVPRLTRILTTGDADQDGDFYGDRETGDPDFPPIVSLHVGVITPDMGTGGFTVPTCLGASYGDDAVLRTTGGFDDMACPMEHPAFIDFTNGAGQPIEELGIDVACAARLGTGGCGFEQQLEAVLKAMSPSMPGSGVAPWYDPPRFFGDTAGHGDGANAGFLRDDSVLAVLIYTDEADCSARDPELFNTTSDVYTEDLNLRCSEHADEALHPVTRYVDGLTQLRPHPSRLAYVLVAGVPPDLAPSAGDPIDWDALASDERLELRVDPEMPGRLTPACSGASGVAYPPPRMLAVGRGLERNGAHVGISSICKYDSTDAVDALVAATGLAVRR